MGLILDSTVWIGAERRGLTVVDVLRAIRRGFRDPEIAIAAMTAGELIHGVWRANRPEVRAHREEFIEEIFARVPVQFMSLRTARVFGRLDAQCRTKGITVPTADLIIGATAFDLGFSVVTRNIRHYRLIPGLTVRLLEP